MMQLSGMSYIHISQMPVDDVNKYIDWKIKYDKEVQKAKQKAFDEMKAKSKSKHR